VLFRSIQDDDECVRETKFLYAGNCGMGGQEMTQNFTNCCHVTDGSHQVYGKAFET
jgi:hypothetical protein